MVWRDRDAAVSIVENNLYGLDIDERAYQLAYFSIMMKGCLYNRRFLKINISNHLTNIIETNELESLSYEGMEETEEIKKKVETKNKQAHKTIEKSMMDGFLLEGKVFKKESVSVYLYRPSAVDKEIRNEEGAN